jgi:hypothetical protein
MLFASMNTDTIFYKPDVPLAVCSRLEGANVRGRIVVDYDIKNFDEELCW